MQARANLSILDDPAHMRARDPGDMLGRIGELAQQVHAAWDEARRLELPLDYRDARNIVILGMGGSAIGGELLRTLTYAEARVPLVICREYDLPGFVGPESLVIAVSFSGNTEETLSAFGQAIERRARLLAVASGGRLAELAEQRGVPLYRFSYTAQPRAARMSLYRTQSPGLGSCDAKPELATTITPSRRLSRKTVDLRIILTSRGSGCAIQALLMPRTHLYPSARRTTCLQPSH